MPRSGFYQDGSDDSESETEPYEGDSASEQESVVSRRSRHRHREEEDHRRARQAREDERDDRRERRERSERPRSFVGQAFGNVNAPTAATEGPSQPDEDHLADRVAATVTANLGAQLRDILAEKDGKAEEMAKEVEALRAAQKHASLLTEATELRSESAQKQFLAFAKIKAEVANVRRLMSSGDLVGADAALVEVEKITDFRLDMVRRADSMPGGWAAATIYERRLAGQTETKNDKVWKAAVEEATQTRKVKRKFPDRDATVEGRNNRPFQGTIKPVYVFPFCSDLNFIASFVSSFTEREREREREREKERERETSFVPFVSLCLLGHYAPACVSRRLSLSLGKKGFSTRRKSLFPQ